MSKVPILGSVFKNTAEAHIRAPEDYVNGKYSKKLARENEKKAGIERAGWLGDTTSHHTSVMDKIRRIGGIGSTLYGAGTGNILGAIKGAAMSGV